MRNAIAALVVSASTVCGFAGQISGVTSTAMPYSGTVRDAAPSRDGSVWFVDQLADVIGRIDGEGNVKTYPYLPGVFLHNVKVDRDANAWVTANGHIARVTPGGLLEDFPVAGNPGRLAPGADRAIWFIDSNGFTSRIGRITAAGAVTEYDIGANHIALDLTTGPDGNIWFIDGTANAVVKLSLAGSILATYPIPSPATFADEMVLGPDHNIWFTHGNNIDRITPDGVITEYPVPTPNSFPFPITVGADGNIWFAEYSSSQVGEVVLSKTGGKPTINESGALLNGPGVLFPLPGNSGVKTTDFGAPSCPKVAFGSAGEKQPSGTNFYAVTLSTPPAKCADLYIAYAGVDAQSGGYDFEVGNNGRDPATPFVDLDLWLLGATVKSITFTIGGTTVTCMNGPCDSPRPLSKGDTAIVRLYFHFTPSVSPQILIDAVTGPVGDDIEDPNLWNNFDDAFWDGAKPADVLPPDAGRIAPPLQSRH